MGFAELQACPFPDDCLPTPSSLCLLPPFTVPCKMILAGQTWWTGVITIALQFASLYDGQEVFVWSDMPAGSWHGHPRWQQGLCMRYIISCGSSSFQWLVFFGALLWGSMIHKHTGIWMWQGSAPVISWNWEKYSGSFKMNIYNIT